MARIYEARSGLKWRVNLNSILPSSLDYRVCHKLQILSLQLKKRNFNFFGIAPARIWTQDLLITGLAPQTTHPSWVVLKWSGKKVVYKFELFGNIFNFPSKKMKKHTENIFESAVETFKRKDLWLPMQKCQFFGRKQWLLWASEDAIIFSVLFKQIWTFKNNVTWLHLCIIHENNLQNIASIYIESNDFF